MAGATKAMTNPQSHQAGESWRPCSTFRKRGQWRLCSRSSSIAVRFAKNGCNSSPDARKCGGRLPSRANPFSGSLARDDSHSMIVRQFVSRRKIDLSLYRSWAQLRHSVTLGARRSRPISCGRDTRAPGSQKDSLASANSIKRRPHGISVRNARITKAWLAFA
jgi:hypothetical protein